MRIARVVGKVSLSRCHPTFIGARLRLVQPMSLAEIKGERSPQADEIVVWDEFASGIGDLIAIAEGGEAAQPFRPNDKAVDAYAAAILDTLNID